MTTDAEKVLADEIFDIALTMDDDPFEVAPKLAKIQTLLNEKLQIKPCQLTPAPHSFQGDDMERPLAERLAAA